jgi:hypothetical protein
VAGDQHDLPPDAVATTDPADPQADERLELIGDVTVDGVDLIDRHVEMLVMHETSTRLASSAVNSELVGLVSAAMVGMVESI